MELHRRLALSGLFACASTATVAACSLLVDSGGLAGGPGSPDGAGVASPAGDGALGSGDGGGGGGDAGGDGDLLPDSGGQSSPSCLPVGPGRSDCGPRSSESCCASPSVTGGVFKRGHDGVFNYDLDHPAEVTSFRLDRYEITVGRFRSFVAATVDGWTPAAGAGKHVHLNGSNGLAAAVNDAGLTYEPGWDGSLTGSLPRTALAWSTNLQCDPSFQTWTTSPGPNERRPINCVAWHEAYAFCIWDGGFLPSEAELAYAEAGGDDQRVYPWSVPPSSTTIDCSYENGNGCGNPPSSTTNDVGSESPKGDGRYLQADLAGNMREWTLDIFVDPYEVPCVDCVIVAGGTDRATHGSGFFFPFGGSSGVFRGSAPGRDKTIGARCARVP